MTDSRAQAFEEWRQEKLAQSRMDKGGFINELFKAPARGGFQSPISPAFTSSRAPTGPSYRNSGNQGIGYTGTGESKYLYERQDQPPPYISDVDMASTWWSPMEPVWPYGPPNVTRPREWNYPVGYNLNYIPQRSSMMYMLRAMRANWGVLATIIETRKDQLLRIPWNIQVKGKPKGDSASIDLMKKFFRRPDGKLSYGQWSRKILDDLFVLDAPTIYFSRDRKGRPLTAEALDGATIFPLIDDAGRRPESIVELGDDGIEYLRRQPAFQQIIYGLPMIDLDESELMYVPMRPRPDLPVFGFPPTEQILQEAIEAILKTNYQRNFWQEGTLPDLVVTVPDAWSPRQIAMFQAHFDALLSGNLKLKSHVRFLPGGMKPFDIKNSSGESLWSQRDETLIRLACYAYSVSPTPFVKATNRGTASTVQEVAEQEGLYPLMSWWKDDIIDPIIEKFGFDDVEFVFLPQPETDQEKAAKIYDLQLRSGTKTINEIREERGEEPDPDGNVLLVYTANGAVPLKDVVQGKLIPPTSAGTEAGSDSESSAPGSKPKPDSTSSPAGARPIRGPNRPPNSSPVPTAKLDKATKAELQAAADQAKGHLDDLSPSQASAGNYPKGHIWIQGLNISIENNKGSLRGEKDTSGKKWQVRMPAPYGYIRGTVGADGDSVDVYLGKNPNSETVWVIDQRRVSKKGKPKKFDEHKVFIGYKKLKTAMKDWLKSHFDDHGHDRISAITELSMDELKAWLKTGDLKEPLSDQNVGTPVDLPDSLKKLDTVSTATNLISTGNRLPKKRKKKKKPSPGARWLELGAI